MFRTLPSSSSLILRFATILSASFFCIAHADAANRYWVGTTNRWETTANWAATSGGAGGQTVPGSSDIAIFDGGGSSDVLLRSAVSVQGLLLASTTTKTVTVGTGSFVIGSSNLRVGAGTLRGTGRPLRVAGSLTQTGGLIVETSNTLSVSGSLSITTGGIFQSTGTIIFSGNTNQNFVIDATANVLIGQFVLRNTGTAGNNLVTINCSNFATHVCASGDEGLYSGGVTVTQGNLDLATYSQILIMLDSNFTVANNASASATFGNGGLALSGSVTVGTAASVTFGNNAGITFGGTGTMTINLNGASIPDITVATLDSVPGLNGCPKFVLANNLLITRLFTNSCTVQLSTHTLAATGADIINLGTITLQSGKYVNAGTGFLLYNDTYTTSLSSVGIGNRLYVSIRDYSRNLIGTSTESFTIALTTSEGDSETLALTEAYVNGYLGIQNIYGYFRNSIGTTQDSSVTVGDGIIQLIGNSTTVTLTYTDPVDGLSNTTTITLSRSASTSSAASSGGGGGGSRRTLPGSSSSSSSTSSISSVSSSASSASSSSSKGFKDVPSNAWFASFVNKLASMGIVSGYKDAEGNPLHEFRPANSVTYAEIAKMAAEAVGLSPLTGSSMNTSDDGQWSEGYVALLESREVSVFQNHALDVNTPAPRGAVVQILLEMFDVTLSTSSNPYSDVPSSSPFASAILQATHDGIVAGDDGATTFRPADSINRAETAKMVRKVMEVYGE